MVTFGMLMIFVVLWCIPGLYLARGMYAQAIKEIGAQQVTVVPPKPKRPEIQMNEMLHTSAPKKCNYLSAGRACNCHSRSDWITLKNEWIDYNEWVNTYGHIRNGVAHEPQVDMRPIYLAVPAWPLVAGAMFIKGGAKNIPDYRAIERMENELKEIN